MMIAFLFIILADVKLFSYTIIIFVAAIVVVDFYIIIATTIMIIINIDQLHLK